MVWIYWTPTRICGSVLAIFLPLPLKTPKTERVQNEYVLQFQFQFRMFNTKCIQHIQKCVCACVCSRIWRQTKSTKIKTPTEERFGKLVTFSWHPNIYVSGYAQIYVPKSPTAHALRNVMKNSKHTPSIFIVVVVKRIKFVGFWWAKYCNSKRMGACVCVFSKRGAHENPN